jgi:tRNA (guanine-N7-)-methyltransferase
MSQNETRHRTIRSFVKRAGRMTASQERALKDLWPVYGVEYSASKLDLDELFGRSAPRVLEIGFGNGDTLVVAAANAPDTDFIGIEVHDPGIGHCLIRAREAGIDNLRVIAHDAIDVLTNQVPDESLARVNLYFPDPWPKKRHHKRRIVQPPFLDLLARKLSPGGRFCVATDWENYAGHIDDTMARRADFTLVERREHEGNQPLDRERTKFETRGLKRGHRIWDWQFTRT